MTQCIALLVKMPVPRLMHIPTITTAMPHLPCRS